MTTAADDFLDLSDIQGIVVKAYSRFGFPVARYVLFRIDLPAHGRKFVVGITPMITTGVRWTDPASIPSAATNIAFTYKGLKHLDVLDASLHGFSDEFSMGMKARRDIVGDTGPNHPRHWDPVWHNESETGQHVHILVTIDGKGETEVEARYRQILALLVECPGVVQLSGQRGGGSDDLPYQPAAAIPPKPEEAGFPGGKEHFGYSDGISTTFFKGCGADPMEVIGEDKPVKGDPRTLEGWAPVAAGELIFGYPDEAFEYPEAPGPPLFSRNGTYLVYRKLHENTGSFESYLEAEGARFPGGKEALAAKFAGRWRNGAPLATFPTQESADRYIAELSALQLKVWAGQASPAEQARYQELALQLVALDYGDDKDGARCPFGAHTRRVNPRSALRFGNKKAFADDPGALSNRRRVLRRGLPYGRSETPARDDGDHGIVIMIVNADLSRQFEFVQQQWITFGNDFKLANDQDPLPGNHGTSKNCRAGGRMII